MRLPAFRLLDKEQDRILNLPLDGSYLITGPPGSGKTVIALYRAKMINERNEHSVLLVFNNTLKTYVSAATKKLKIEAETHGYYPWLTSKFLHYFSIRPPMLSDFEHDWARILSKVNAKPPPRGNLPYVIVDEGQDLHPMFFQLIRYLSKNLTVLADGNQVLTSTNSSLDEIRLNAMITKPTQLLVKNYRNSRQIAQLAACFHSGIETGVAELPSRTGPPIKIRCYQVRQQAVDYIRRYQEQHPKADIAVFLPDKKSVKSYVYRLVKDLGEGCVQYYYREGSGKTGRTVNTLDFSKPAVRVMNYWSAKGLEADAVFLPELQDFRQDPTSGSTKMLFYVLLSRARQELYLSYVKDETSLIKDLKKYIDELAVGDSEQFDGNVA